MWVWQIGDQFCFIVWFGEHCLPVFMHSIGINCSGFITNFWVDWGPYFCGLPFFEESNKSVIVVLAYLIVGIEVPPI